MSSGDDLIPEGGDSTGPTTDAAQGSAFFKSAGGLTSDSEVSDYEEGGVSDGSKHGAPPPEFTSGDPLRLEATLQFDSYEGREGVSPVRDGALDTLDTSAIREAAAPPPPPDAALPSSPALLGKTPGPPQVRTRARGWQHVVLGVVFGAVVLGGILAVVVQGGLFPFFPSSCSATHGQRGPILALFADPVAPCANATATTAQATTIPQATSTLAPEPTATVAPQPTNTAQPQPPRLTVTPPQATAFCLNGSYPALTVKNMGGKTLTWSASGPSTPPVTLSPASGSLAPGATQMVAVSGQHPGPTVVIAFSGNGGNATVTFSCQ